MRGTKATLADEDYEVGADVEEGRPSATDKPLSSKYRGVCWNRKNRRWQAAINSGGKYVYLGSFVSEYDAARAFDKAAVKLRGTRAKLNFSYSDYVDEDGNLLEDPKMKNVMYKIEAIQGGGGGNHGGDGHHRHKAEHCSDDANGLSEGGLPPLPAPKLREDVAASQGGAAAPHRQLSPLLQGVAAIKQQQVCSSDGTTGPERQPQCNGGMHQHQHQQHQHQHQHQQVGLALTGPCAQQHQQHAVDPPLFPHFPDSATAGQPLGGSGALGRGETAGGGMAAPPMPPPPSAPPGRTNQPAGRARPPPQTHAPMLPLPPYGPHGAGGASGHSGLLGPGGDGGGASNGYDASPMAPTLNLGGGQASGYGGGGAARGTLSPAMQRAILRDLPPGSSVHAYVPNGFASHMEDMCGVLYREGTAPGLVGSSVWTGSTSIKMGLYDTERDARQAAIKCMQLYCAFYSDDWRVDFFNALTAMGGAAAEPHGGDQANGGQHGGGPPPPPLPPMYGARGASRGSGGGGFSIGGNGILDPHHQSQQVVPYMRANGGGTAYGGSNDGRGSLQQAAPSGPGNGINFGQGYDALADGGGGGASPQQGGNSASQAGLNDLFHYMAGYNRKASDAGGDGSTADAQGGGGGKRGAPDDYGTLQGHQQQQQQRHPEAKRLRLDSGAGVGGELGGGPGSEFRAAHKLQLPALAKQLQQAAGGGL